MEISKKVRLDFHYKSDIIGFTIAGQSLKHITCLWKIFPSDISSADYPVLRLLANMARWPVCNNFSYLWCNINKWLSLGIKIGYHCCTSKLTTIFFMGLLTFIISSSRKYCTFCNLIFVIKTLLSVKLCILLDG